MNILTLIAIYLGSALMVYNIIRYYMFSKNIRKIGFLKISSAFINLPFMLLIFFLIGYLVIALFGKPNPVMAGVLFGGSIYVFLMLSVMFRIVRHISNAEKRSHTMYDELREELTTLTKDSLAVFRVNLTKDTIEDIAGTDLYVSDLIADSYSELLQNRSSDMLVKPAGNNQKGLFTCEGLIEHFQNGHNSAREVVYSRRKSVKNGYYLMEASLIQQPSTGDIIAFITERDYNREIIDEVIWNMALREEYENVAYIAGEQLGIILDNNHGEKFRRLSYDNEILEYETFITQLINSHNINDKNNQLFERLCISRIEKELSDKDTYTVDFSYNINSEKVYKRVTFFVVDREAHFYTVMFSDTTDIRREQEEQKKALENALEQAKASNAAKTVFLSNMSHDIRTPMNAIIGFANLAKQNADDTGQTQEYLDKILVSSDHLLSLINDVLEMSRIESGKIEFNNGPCNLDEIMEDLKAMVLNQSKKRKQELLFDFSGVTDKNIICDKLRLKQVLLNLLSNAVKYTPDHGRIQVRALQKGSADNGKASYEFHIKDNGIGMSSEFAAHVFEAFEREKTSTISGIQGTGLGMAITKNIVDLMHGTIEVITAPGEGTEFIVCLDMDVSAENKADDKSATEDHSDIDFTGKRLLLVDDMDINREIAKALLQMNGFLIDEAVNGEIAVSMVKDSAPGYYDAVLMDIQMPVMNGYEASVAIRALENPLLASIPVIAMTANAFEEDRKNAMDAGMNGHVAKPINADELLGTLADLLFKNPKKGL